MSQASRSGPTGPEQAAVRNLLFSLAQMDGRELDADNYSLVEVARMAGENVATLQERVSELETAVETLDARAPDPEQKEYDNMDRSDKATVVRSKLRSEANATNGKARATYNDVIRIFDGRPSPGHAYDIMETVGEMDGFEMGTSPDGTKRLTYNERRCE